MKPQITIRDAKHLRDLLEIYIRKNHVEIHALIDDCGNTFKINKQELKEALYGK